MTVYQTLIEKLHRGKNPYTGYPASEWAGVWYGDPGAQRQIFKKAIDRAKPGLIIECGSFVGESTIFMAEYLKSTKRDAAILAVDTWLGGFDHVKGAPEKFNMHFGRADFYYRFMSNVVQRGCQDVIVPMAMDSLNASRVLKLMGIVPSLVYLDASHERGDVLRDLMAYWDLLPSGGVMMADDISRHFEGVVEDWVTFTGSLNLIPLLIEGEKQLIVKP